VFLCKEAQKEKLKDFKKEDIDDVIVRDWIMEINKIYNQDCLDFMKKLPDDYFDLIITDPPYGIKRNKLNMGKGGGVAKHIDYGDYKWDDEIPSSAHFFEMLRISKNQIIFGGNYMTEYLPPSSCWIVWDKDNGNTDFADCELAWCSFDTAVRKFKYKWSGMLQENMSWKEKRLHPTQKPVALGRWILEKFANKGDRIFDPFAGSGSFLVACKQLRFEYVGCEINKSYVDIAIQRLSQKTLMEVRENERYNL